MEEQTVELEFLYGGARIPLSLRPSEPLEKAMDALAQKTGVRPARQILLAAGVMGPLQPDGSAESYGLGSGARVYVYGSNRAAAAEQQDRQDDAEGETAPAAGPQAVGIANPSNLCFANSVLQLLYTSAPFCRVVEDMLPVQELAQGSPDLAMAEALVSALSTLHAAKETLYPANFMRACASLFPDLFQGGIGMLHQQDAQEFCQRLLLWLAAAAAPLQLRVASPADKELRERLEATGRAMGYRDFVHELFGFRLVRGPGGVQSMDTLFLDIHIDSSTTSLELQLDRQMNEGFENLVRQGEGSGGSGGSGEGGQPGETGGSGPSEQAAETGGDVAASSAGEPPAAPPAASRATPAAASTPWMFYNLPDFLLVHFLRYTWDETEGRGQKIRRPVRFPEELDLAPFASPEALARLPENSASEIGSAAPGAERTPGRYVLDAVISHKGASLTSGHYIAYARRQGQWTRLSDHLVDSCDLEQVLALAGTVSGETAYLLLYRRG